MCQKLTSPPPPLFKHCSKLSQTMQIHHGKGPVLRRPRRASDCDWPCGRKGTPGPAATPTRGCPTPRPWQPWSAATCPPVLWQSGHPLTLWWTPSLPPAQAPCSSCRGSCGSAPPPPGHRQWWSWRVSCRQPRSRRCGRWGSGTGCSSGCWQKHRW